MNQVIIAQRVVTSGNIASPRPYQIGATVDGIQFSNGVGGTNFTLLSSLVINNGELHTKAIEIPKDRTVVFSAFSENQALLSFKVKIEENKPIDFYILDSGDIQNDYKYPVYLENIPDLEDSSPIIEKVQEVLDKISAKYKGEFAVDSDSISEGVLTIAIQYDPVTNLKAAGKNVTIDYENSNVYPQDTSLKVLLDKHIQQFGINHREHDNEFYNTIVQELKNTTFTSLCTIRFKNPRVASVTHDEDLYQNVYILATEDAASALTNLLNGTATEPSEEATPNIQS